MSLADRLNSVVPARSNNGCLTCQWLDSLPREDRQAFDQWVNSGNSLSQLWEICLQDGLEISLTGFRAHMKHHESR